MRKKFEFSHLRVNADSAVALFARVGELLLVAAYAVGVLLPEDIALSGQALVTLPAAEVLSMPVLVHRVRILRTEN